MSKRNTLTIVSAIPYDDFSINIVVSNGKSFVFDMKPYFSYPAFKKMQNLAFFKQVKYRGEMLYWDDMHDFPLHCMNLPQERC